MRRRIGPTAVTEERIAVIYRSLKKAGRRGTYLSELLKRANEQLEPELQIRSLSHLHFLLFGWPKGPRSTIVGGYFRKAIERVPSTPKNATFVRLRAGVRKRDVTSQKNRQGSTAWRGRSDRSSARDAVSKTSRSASFTFAPKCEG